MSDEVLEAVQHLANCQGPCMDGKSLRLVREYIRDAESQNQALQEALQRALDRYDREDNGTLKVRDGLAWAMAQDLRAALSPTQETDPE